jgi:hypothetical protein
LRRSTCSWTTSSRALAIGLLLLGAPARADDPKAFVYQLPEVFLRELVRTAVLEAKVKVARQEQALPISDVDLDLLGARRLALSVTAGVPALVELARKVAPAVERLLGEPDPSRRIVFRLSGRLEVLTGQPGRTECACKHTEENEAATVGRIPRDGPMLSTTTLAFTFAQEDISLEIRGAGPGEPLASAGSGLRELGLHLVDRYLRDVHLAGCLLVDAQVRWATRGGQRRPDATGHRILACFLYEKFPFVPFVLRPEGLSTDGDVLRLTGRSQ